MYKLITTPISLNPEEVEKAQNIFYNLYCGMIYICFVCTFIYLIVHCIYVIICTAKKKHFSKRSLGCPFILISLFAMTHNFAGSICIEFFDVLFVLAISLDTFCVILEQSILHGGFLRFMRWCAIRFFKSIESSRNFILNIQLSEQFQKLLAVIGLLFGVYTTISFFVLKKVHEIDMFYGLVAIYLFLVAFNFLGECLVSARKLALLYFLTSAICCGTIATILLEDFQEMIQNWFWYCFNLTIALSLVWGILTVLAEKSCSQIVLSCFSFLTTLITIVINIFLLVFLPYLEKLSQAYPELSFEVSTASSEIALILNIIFVPMLIAINFASFLKDLQGYTEHLIKEENSQL